MNNKLYNVRNLVNGLVEYLHVYSNISFTLYYNSNISDALYEMLNSYPDRNVYSIVTPFGAEKWLILQYSKMPRQLSQLLFSLLKLSTFVFSSLLFLHFVMQKPTRSQTSSISSKRAIMDSPIHSPQLPPKSEIKDSNLIRKNGIN